MYVHHMFIEVCHDEDHYQPHHTLHSSSVDDVMCVICGESVCGDGGMDRDY